LLLIGVPAGASQAGPASSSRPGAKALRTSKVNGRYFTDGSGRAVYLTGSHVWWNLQGERTWKVSCEDGRAVPFRYADYLDRLVSHGHNFIRLWRIELTRWHECGEDVAVAPQPWRRPGPGLALDGLPKFDLSRFNPAYFHRLRARVAAADRRGIYVAVMLFEGWSAQFEKQPWRAHGHPFFPRNNVNGLHPDLDGDGTLHEVYTLRIPRIRRIQEAYVRKVIDTVGRYDNVLYEIANESGAFSIPWQYRMIDYVRRYERARRLGPRPVGMSYVHGDSGDALHRSRADWIAPADYRFFTDPPAATARQVMFWDTDHQHGGSTDAAFAWRAFTRGYNPIFMDEFTAEPRTEAIRRALGVTRRYARRIDLVRMAPRGDLCSTGYCLVRPGREYLVYQPGRGPFTVDLSPAPGRRFTLEWADPVSGRVAKAAGVEGGAERRLSPPFAGPAVAYLRRR
jgi:Family of unknown function (DUF6298)/Protein of unknown function (DUF4038)